MIKVSISYFRSDDGCFDHDYYLSTHIPMVKEVLGDVCVRCEIDKGMFGAKSEQQAEVVAAVQLYVTSVDDFNEKFSVAQKEIIRDIKNYTNIMPSMQVMTGTAVNC